MNKAQWALLTEAEQALIRETGAEVLALADEDELVALHTRVRRARDKYSKLHRRRASAEVGARGRRAGAGARHARTAEKAEIFEDALAVVSKALARAAKASAAQLRAERLEAARAAKARPVGEGGPEARRSSAKSKKGTDRRVQTAERKPAVAKQRASTKAAGKRNQAERDKR